MSDYENEKTFSAMYLNDVYPLPVEPKGSVGMEPMKHEPLEWGTKCLQAPDCGPHECAGGAACADKHICLRCGALCLCRFCNAGEPRIQSSISDALVHPGILRHSCIDPPSWPRTDIPAIPAPTQEGEGATLAGDGPCRDCGVDPQIWFTENAVWNAVVDGPGILCATCFIKAANAKGFDCTGWILVPERPERGLCPVCAEFTRDCRCGLSEPRQSAPASRHCCFIGCDKSATWQAWDGTGLDDYTEACDAHLGKLLSDASEHRIFPISDLMPSPSPLEPPHRVKYALKRIETIIEHIAHRQAFWENDRQSILNELLDVWDHHSILPAAPLEPLSDEQKVIPIASGEEVNLIAQAQRRNAFAVQSVLFAFVNMRNAAASLSPAATDAKNRSNTIADVLQGDITESSVTFNRSAATEGGAKP